MSRLTRDRLKHLLSFDPDTGSFTWVNLPSRFSNRRLIGSVAGGADGQGYIRIRIDGVHHAAHRLAWLYVHGAWPDEQIDHINGCRSDNRLCNLREATNAQNCRNRKCRADSTSGSKGVSWHKRDRKWRAYIAVGGKIHCLGSHDTKDAAALAYARAAPMMHAEFARLA